MARKDVWAGAAYRHIFSRIFIRLSDQAFSPEGYVCWHEYDIQLALHSWICYFVWQAMDNKTYEQCIFPVKCNPLTTGSGLRSKLVIFSILAVATSQITRSDGLRSMFGIYYQLVSIDIAISMSQSVLVVALYCAYHLAPLIHLVCGVMQFRTIYVFVVDRVGKSRPEGWYQITYGRRYWNAINGFEAFHYQWRL